MYEKTDNILGACKPGLFKQISYNTFDSGPSNNVQNSCHRACFRYILLPKAQFNRIKKKKTNIL